MFLLEFLRIYVFFLLSLQPGERA